MRIFVQRHWLRMLDGPFFSMMCELLARDDWISRKPEGT